MNIFSEYHILTSISINPDGSFTEQALGRFSDEWLALQVSSRQPWDGSTRCYHRLESYGLGMTRRVLTRPVGFDWH